MVNLLWWLSFLGYGRANLHDHRSNFTILCAGLLYHTQGKRGWWSCYGDRAGLLSHTQGKTNVRTNKQVVAIPVVFSAEIVCMLYSLSNIHILTHHLCVCLCFTMLVGDEMNLKCLPFCIALLFFNINYVMGSFSVCNSCSRVFPSILVFTKGFLQQSTWTVSGRQFILDICFGQIF